MNYTIENDLYKANEGYIFRNKENGYTCSIMKLANTDSIDNYKIIEKPVEEEIIEEENLENLSKEELIERLQNTKNQNI